jgi:hypothetical protein
VCGGGTGQSRQNLVLNQGCLIHWFTGAVNRMNRVNR